MNAADAIVTCPCGQRNRLPTPRPSGRFYLRCGRCKVALPLPLDDDIIDDDDIDALDIEAGQE